ncbi:NlpC/P60 family protein [Streptomyces sp. NPDC127117]|uniref:NlpC/P60 family protein n=1 Tax=Streptomyces sp. NPDC127117 TaxID=3345368 RepID=UPI0036380C08
MPRKRQFVRWAKSCPTGAHTEAGALHDVGCHVPPVQPLLPGDLVFYGNTPANVHHVGLCIGGGLMNDASGNGQRVGSAPHTEARCLRVTRPGGTTRGRRNPRSLRPA